MISSVIITGVSFMWSERKDDSCEHDVVTSVNMYFVNNDE